MAQESQARAYMGDLTCNYMLIFFVCFVSTRLSVDPVLVMCRAVSNLFRCARLAAAKGDGGTHEEGEAGPR